MKQLSIVLFMLLIYSCKSKEEKLKEKITPIIQAAVLKDSTVVNIDSLIIYKIDTLTALKDSLSKISRLMANVDFENRSAKNSVSMAELIQESAKIDISQAKLYREVFGKGVLSEAKTEDAKNNVKKSNKYLDEASAYTAKSDYYLSRVTNIKKLVSLGKIDSVTFRGYIVTYRIKGSDKDNISVKKDSLMNMINPDFRIISYGDINRK